MKLEELLSARSDFSLCHPVDISQALGGFVSKREG